MYLYIVCFCPVCASVMRGRTVYRETGRKETRGGRNEKRVGEKRRGAGEWISVHPVHPLCYGTAFSLRPLLLHLLFSPSRPSSPFSQPTSPFPGSFLLVSLYPLHSLSETPLNCHRNVYVKLTPQSGQSLKTIRIFWSHCWTVYRSFSLYIIYILKMCILFGPLEFDIY